MKKTIIAVIAAVLVIAIAATSIFLVTAKESKQLTSENLSTYYDVKIEITDYIRGERDVEILGLIATYSASTAKIHITVTPKDTGDTTVTVDLNPEGVTETIIDIEADLKISTIAAPEISAVEITDAVGTVTYKKFFNKLG